MNTNRCCNFFCSNLEDQQSPPYTLGSYYTHQGQPISHNSDCDQHNHLWQFYRNCRHESTWLQTISRPRSQDSLHGDSSGQELHSGIDWRTIERPLSSASLITFECNVRWKHRKSSLKGCLRSINKSTYLQCLAFHTRTNHYLLQ